MCDTFGLPSDYSENGISWFAKNSDRSPNEPHLIVHVPGRHYSKGETVSLTYITIPQTLYTREMILCKPSWTWGAEMGVNEDRVAIGNEAVFTKAKKGPPALLGMDLLRLALERAGTARDAVNIMISLLETYGQGGNCGFDHQFFYDNSFLVIDTKEMFIMETSGKNYAVWKSSGECAISNRLTIRKEHIERKGLNAGDDFAGRFTEPVFSFFSGAKERRMQVLEKLSSKLDAEKAFEILRNHNTKADGQEFTQGSVNSVCMHAGGLIGDHTTGSLVAALRKDKPVTLWCTGSSTPCISAFKPVFWGSPFPPVFSDSIKSEKYWLEREHVHRAVIAGRINVSVLRSRIKALEKTWLSKEQELMSEEVPDKVKLFALSKQAAEEEQVLIDEFYTSDWQAAKGRRRFAGYWKGKNAKLGQGRDHG